MPKKQNADAFYSGNFTPGILGRYEQAQVFSKFANEEKTIRVLSMDAPHLWIFDTRTVVFRKTRRALSDRMASPNMAVSFRNLFTAVQRTNIMQTTHGNIDLLQQGYRRSLHTSSE